LAQGSTPHEKLLPPLVASIRSEVKAWRDSDYAGASATSKALLKWWFETDHLIEQADGTLAPFRYYFAQREAVETVIWLHDVRAVRDKFDLMRFDASGAVSAGMFDEDWPRYVLKMATGAGKTKVLSLLIAWSLLPQALRADSTLARNFLLIAPNIIVLDRLRADFDGLRIFFNDPILPDNGHEGPQLARRFPDHLHIQDDVRVVRDTGNLFLTNIHRVYLGDVPEPFAGRRRPARLLSRPLRPQAGRQDHRQQDRPGRDCPRDRRTRRLQRRGPPHPRSAHGLVQEHPGHPSPHAAEGLPPGLADRCDRHAAPQQRRHLRPNRFRLPAGRGHPPERGQAPRPAGCRQPGQLARRKSAIFTEKYADYLQLGIEEWRKSYAEHEKLGKKAVLFVMVDDTRNCDEVGEYLQKICPELQDGVLVIHTKNNGEISEAASGKNKEELGSCCASNPTRSTPGSRPTRPSSRC
jgi:type III restriction enzyme